MSFNDAAMIGVGIAIIGWTISIIYCFIRHIFGPKTDKQLQIIDAYIDSVSKANDLITVSLPINNKKTYMKLIRQLQKEFEKLFRMVRSVKGVGKVSHGNFVFSNYYPKFTGREIYDYFGWQLSPSETLSLMKEWPEAKLEILKIHKQNILDFNSIVNELASLV